MMHFRLLIVCYTDDKPKMLVEGKSDFHFMYNTLGILKACMAFVI